MYGNFWKVSDRSAQEAEVQAKLDDLAKTEKMVLEKDSIPLKQYLVDTVMGPITTALYEIAKVQPEDPVDYLVRRDRDGDGDGVGDAGLGMVMGMEVGMEWRW